MLPVLNETGPSSILFRFKEGKRHEFKLDLLKLKNEKLEKVNYSTMNLRSFLDHVRV